MLFTSRERLPAPFADPGCVIRLGALSPGDAVELVANVMKHEGRAPRATDPGGTPEEIRALVESVGRHARALTLLAREVAHRGVRATTANVHRLMADLHRQHLDDRERSLFASVELSLRRLKPETREQIRALAMFQGGAHWTVVGRMLGTPSDDFETVLALFRELIAVGLGQDMGYGHLRLDPALPAYLLGPMTPAEQAEMRARWAEAMRGLLYSLYEQLFQNTQMAAQLTLLELPNLLAGMDWWQDKLPPEELVEATGRVEELVVRLGRPQALARVVAVREEAAARLVGWGHARYLTAVSTIQRLLGAGDLWSALAAAQKLLADCLYAGESAYPHAAYDIATAHLQLGHVLQMSSAAEAALEALATAQERFEKLAAAGDRGAERMASDAIGERGDCLRALGRLDEAAAANEESIRRAEKRGDRRSVAVGKAQLGTVRMVQGRYADALAAYREAKDTFEALGRAGQPRSGTRSASCIGRPSSSTRRRRLSPGAGDRSAAAGP